MVKVILLKLERVMQKRRRCSALELRNITSPTTSWPDGHYVCEGVCVYIRYMYRYVVLPGAMCPHPKLILYHFTPKYMQRC